MSTREDAWVTDRRVAELHKSVADMQQQLANLTNMLTRGSGGGGDGGKGRGGGGGGSPPSEAAPIFLEVPQNAAMTASLHTGEDGDFKDFAADGDGGERSMMCHQYVTRGLADQFCSLGARSPSPETLMRRSSPSVGGGGESDRKEGAQAPTTPCNTAGPCYL
jgi:hypothetical protein